jgi:membrane protease YdiL (CAAX protease family)
MEKSIIDLFWNSADRRLRAFWRILIQDTVWFALQIGSGLVVGVVLIVALALGGTMSMGDLLGSSDKLLDFLNTPLMNLALQVMVFLITLATVALAGRFLDRRRFAGFGFHFSKLWWLDFGFGLFLGGLLMAAIFAVEFAAGWIRVTGALETTEPGGFFPLMILLPLILFVFVGISEELYHRGYRLKNFSEGLNCTRFGPRLALPAATLLTSVYFGLMHATNPNVTLVSVLNLMAAGIFLALGCIFTGELALPIGLHIAWNFFQGNVFGFPVSGMDPIAASFLTIRQGGPDFVTGGAFGPEGGWIGVGAMILGSALILLWVRISRGRIALARSLAESPRKKPPADTGSPAGS